MDINETIELSKQGLRRHDPNKDPSASYIHPAAESCVAYMPGETGTEVTAWHNGQQVEVQRIRNAKPDALGFVMFYRPAGATMQITDPVDRRVIYV